MRGNQPEFFFWQGRPVTQQRFFCDIFLEIIFFQIIGCLDGSTNSLLILPPSFLNKDSKLNHKLDGSRGRGGDRGGGAEGVFKLRNLTTDPNAWNLARMLTQKLKLENRALYIDFKFQIVHNQTNKILWDSGQLHPDPQPCFQGMQSTRYGHWTCKIGSRFDSSENWQVEYSI